MPTDHAARNAPQVSGQLSYSGSPRSTRAGLWAYYSLAPTEVGRDELSRSRSSGYTSVPGYLLARLALHVDLRGRGYGAQLLVDALGDHAASFYRHHDFTPVKGNPRRLVLKMANVQTFLH